MLDDERRRPRGPSRRQPARLAILIHALGRPAARRSPVRTGFVFRSSRWSSHGKLPSQVLEGTHSVARGGDDGAVGAPASAGDRTATRPRPVMASGQRPGGSLLLDASAGNVPTGARARLDCPGLLHHSAASELTAFGNCGSSALRIACRRPDRQLQRNAPLGLYADRARRHGKCFRHSRDARTVEPATGSAEVVHALTSPRCRRRARDCSWRGSSVREEEREHPPPQRVAVRLRDARHGTQRVDSRLPQESLRRECIHRIHDRIFRRHGV